MNRDIRTGLITAALMVGGSLALVGLMRAGIVHGDRSQISARGINVLIGLMTVGFASNAAKRLRPLGKLRDPQMEQSIRRFVAWTLATGAMIYTLAWLVAPYEYAFYISMAGLGGAVLIVAARCFAARNRVV